MCPGIGGNPSCKNTSTIINGTINYKLKPIYPEPKFSVETFFGFIFIMICLSWFSFILLNTLKSARNELVSAESDLELQNSEVSEERNSTDQIENNSDHSKISKNTFYILLILQAYLCSFSNGILPSIQSYSNLPYGNVTYHFAVTLSVLSNPIASFLAFQINQKFRKYLIPTLIMIGSFCATYIIITAAHSPTPPLVNSKIGSWIIVFVWMTFTSSFSFTKASIADILRNNTKHGHKALYFWGGFTQIGSAIGSIIMFCVVNYTKIFKSFNPCASH